MTITKEDIKQYVIDGKLPLRFRFNGNLYWIVINDGFLVCNGSTKQQFNNWRKSTNTIIGVTYFNNELSIDKLYLFRSQSNDLSMSLGEVLIWFEINSFRFTNIIYYE